MRKAAAILLAVLAAACDDGALDGPALREALSGNSATGVTGDENPYTVYFEPSGVIHMAVENGFTDVGRWWITANDQYCRRWAQVEGGQEACFDVTKEGDALTFIRGEAELIVTLVDGNPAALPKP